MRILLVESDPALGTFLRKSFESEHYTIDLALDCEAAGWLSRDLPYDAAILDLNLSQPDATNLLRQLRMAHPEFPLLVLTTPAPAESRVQVLDAGADDILLKPFSFSELSARVRALLRRGVRAADAVLRVEDLELSRVEHTVKRSGRKIDLTPKEFALLEFLLRNAGQRVTRAQIIEHVWNLSCDTLTNVVDVYINYSSSQVDRRKVGQLALAIQVAFEKMGIFDAANSRPELVTTEPMPFSKVQILENVPREESLDQVASSPRKDLTTAQTRVRMDKIQNQLNAALSAEIKKHFVSITTTKEGIVVSLRELGFFASGSTVFQPDAAGTLASFIKVVGRYPVRIRIEGHTDNIPISQRAFRLELGTLDSARHGDHQALHQSVCHRARQAICVWLR